MFLLEPGIYNEISSAAILPENAAQVKREKGWILFTLEVKKVVRAQQLLDHFSASRVVVLV